MFRKLSFIILGVTMVVGGTGVENLHAEEPFKVAIIEPFSGLFANAGELALAHSEYYAEMINAQGGLNGRPIEILKYDNQLSSKVAVEKVKLAVADGARIIVQGAGSSIAHAISGAVLRHNTRNPGKEMLYFNTTAQDPALTNEKCNFWHFRFDPHVDMKIKALIAALVKSGQMKKVYVIGQNYSYGQAIAKASEREIAAQAPGVKIVGNELHPLAKIKDFSPYINKIRASGADTVITGNWGTDMTLLVRAANDSGLKVQMATFNAQILGAPTSMGEAGIGALVVSVGNLNDSNITDRKMYLEFRERYKLEYASGYPPIAFEFLVQAAEEAQSTNVVDIARAMEGMVLYHSSGKVLMRKDDHQIIRPIYISEFTRDVKLDQEGLGIGWKTFQRVEGEDTVMPTTCEMERPS